MVPGFSLNTRIFRSQSHLTYSSLTRQKCGLCRFSSDHKLILDKFLFLGIDGANDGTNIGTDSGGNAFAQNVQLVRSLRWSKEEN